MMRFVKFVPRLPALRVRHKLSLSLLALGSALLASSAATYHVSKIQRESLGVVSEEIEAIQTKFIPLGSAVRDLQLDVVQVQQHFNDAALTNDPESYKQAANYAQDVIKQINVVNEIMKDIDRPELKNHYVKFSKAMALLKPQFEGYYKKGLEMAYAYRDKGPEAGKAAMEDFDQSVYTIGLQLDNLLVAQGRMIRQFSRESGEQAQAAAQGAADLNRLTVGLFGFGLVVALAAAIYVRRGVTAPLGRIIVALGQARNGSGDLDLRDAKRRDDLGDLARALQTLRDVQQETMRLEAEALQMRQAGEIEREAAEAARAKAAAQVVHCVQRLQLALGRLADGDLTARVEDAFAEDYESLRLDFNVALEKLAGAMQSVDSAVANVRNGAAEIMAASNDLADRTLKQAASLQQATSRIVDVAGAVRQNSTCADGALQIVGGARKSTERGEGAARAAVDAMKRIAASSSRIGQIIGVIDEIAFQTNLLALNASVEAARAGDAGRGFAVVAAEVRALALRTAEAAKEIKTLIASSTSEVGEGVSLVGRTGEALADIEKQVLEISEAVSLIAANARQEAGALEELTAMARDLDQSVHNNASMSEETTTACASLYRQSDELAELMSNFQAVAPDERELKLAA